MAQDIIQKVTGMVDTLIRDSSLFLVDMKIKPTNNLKVFVDGDAGVTIDAVSKLNRALYKQIEESGMFPDGDFSLEVSSPGVDEPLKFFRQYKKNIGRTVELTLEDGTIRTGVLKEATEAAITIEETIGKKKEKVPVVVPFSTVTKAVIQIIF